jgi:hypothetical protein
MSHTPGPWLWTNAHDGRIYLYTPRNGHCIVMDFVRKGTQGAQPRFSDRGDNPLGGVMHKATEIDIYSNPDARLIAAAPDLLAACKSTLAYIDEVGCGTYSLDAEAMKVLRAAIAKAETA